MCLLVYLVALQHMKEVFPGLDMPSHVKPWEVNFPATPPLLLCCQSPLEQFLQSLDHLITKLIIVCS